ncbi:MAG TPA: hypothetical protein PK467_03840 [Candidatus Wallbacteria bacterium]|nr:hypothetical protein [Candidatus Wallbacteria bacterium]
MEQNQLSNSFFKLASFTLLILSIAIFFGSIFFTAYYFENANSPQQIATSIDLVNKAFLTSIFVLLFAVIMNINYVIKLLEAKDKKE